MHSGRVESLYVGRNNGVRKEECASLEVHVDGIAGDRHSGAQKKADGRDKGIVRGTMIRNWRQWSAISIEELDLIRKNLALENLDGALLGPNLIVSGIENFTLLPRGALLKFSDAELFVEAENDPCTQAGKAIATVHSGITPQTFVKAAWHIRGVVGIVSKSGFIRKGDKIEVILPVPDN